MISLRFSVYYSILSRWHRDANTFSLLSPAVPVALSQSLLETNLKSFWQRWMSQCSYNINKYISVDKTQH